MSFNVRFKQLFKSNIKRHTFKTETEIEIKQFRFKQLFKSNIKTYTFKTETEIEIKNLVTLEKT